VVDCLKVYEPEVLRWIFASYRANTEFQISFDLDVLKLYEDYDSAVRVAYQPDDGGKKDKKRAAARRTLELASLTGHRIVSGDAMPRTLSFRPLSMTLQIFDGDLDRTLDHYAAAGALETDEERARFMSRAARVWHWIEHFAPEEFCYRIRTEPVTRPVDGDAKVLLQRLVTALTENPEMEEPALIEIIKALPEGTEMKRADFFPLVYDLLIDRPKGPKLSTLLSTMGLARAHDLLTPTLA
jgi:lysyl-tRNA synthetase class 1